MSSWIWVVLGTVVFGFVAGASIKLGRKDPVKVALKTGELGPLLESIESSVGDRATTWDKHISTLWNAYERETAAKLVVEGARSCDADILQYWIRQVIEVEPEIATETFTPEFLEACFNADAANRCGRKGCCG